MPAIKRENTSVDRLASSSGYTLWIDEIRPPNYKDSGNKGRLHSIVPTHIRTNKDFDWSNVSNVVESIRDHSDVEDFGPLYNEGEEGLNSTNTASKNFGFGHKYLAENFDLNEYRRSEKKSHLEARDELIKAGNFYLSSDDIKHILTPNSVINTSLSKISSPASPDPDYPNERVVKVATSSLVKDKTKSKIKVGGLSTHIQNILGASSQRLAFGRKLTQEGPNVLEEVATGRHLSIRKDIAEPYGFILGFVGANTKDLNYENKDAFNKYAREVNKVKVDTFDTAQYYKDKIAQHYPNRTNEGAVAMHHLEGKELEAVHLLVGSNSAKSITPFTDITAIANIYGTTKNQGGNTIRRGGVRSKNPEMIERHRVAIQDTPNFGPNVEPARQYLNSLTHLPYKINEKGAIEGKYSGEILGSGYGGKNTVIALMDKWSRESKLGEGKVDNANPMDEEILDEPPKFNMDEEIIDEPPKLNRNEEIIDEEPKFNRNEEIIDEEPVVNNRQLRKKLNSLGVPINRLKK